MTKFMNTEQFVRKARLVHGKTYSYRKTEYVASKEKVVISCNVHGDFLQEPRIHLTGKGCRLCGYENHALKYDTNSFIAEAQKVHGGLYSYKTLEYLGAYEKIHIRCDKHGVFTVFPRPHLKGKGCQRCEAEEKHERNEKARCRKLMLKQAKAKIAKEALALERREATLINIKRRKLKRSREGKLRARSNALLRLQASQKNFVASATKIHGNKYDYSNSMYKNGSTKVIIKCKKHGEFLQSPAGHIYQKQGCTKCARIRIKRKLTKSTQYFIEKAQAKYGKQYSYERANYLGKTKQITVTCKKHGDFEVVAACHMHNKTNYGGCPKCRPIKNKSVIEQKVFKYVSRKTEAVTGDRTILKPLEIDIWCPDERLGIEVNGVYWHSEAHKDKYYHYEKARDAKRAGIKLLQFWETELINKPSICKSMINNALGLNEKYYARKLEIRECKTSFFAENHLSGNAAASICFGLFLGSQCLAAMSFGRPRFSSTYQWELVRFANAKNTAVVGGASRLFAHFIKTFSPKSIISYANLRISYGDLYKTLGFKFSHKSAPNYMWFKVHKTLTRYQTQKHLLPKLLGEKFDISKSEVQNMTDAGWQRVFDAGNLAYVYKSSKCGF